MSSLMKVTTTARTAVIINLDQMVAVDPTGENGVCEVLLVTGRKLKIIKPSLKEFLDLAFIHPEPSP